MSGIQDKSNFKSLLDLFPISKDDDLQTIRAHAGRRLTPDGKQMKYHSPSEKNRKDVRELIATLSAFDKDQTDAKLKKIQDLLQSLNMSGVRPKEYQDCILFYSNTPGFTGCTFYWNPGPSSPTKIIRNIIISHEHSGTDGTDFAALALLRSLNPKCMPCNAVWQKLSDLPSQCQRSSELSNVSHSKDPLYYDIIEGLVKEFPDFPMVNLHGMRGNNSNGRRVTRMVIVNNHNSQFLRGPRSWPLLCSIALAQQDFPIFSIAVGSDLPGFVVTKDGDKHKMTAKNPNAFFLPMSGVQNSNVPGHVANGGSCNRGKYIDHSAHFELGPEYRKKNSKAISRLINSFKQALYWWENYDQEKHNPWQVPDEVWQNFRNYPAYFEHMLKSTEKQQMVRIVEQPEDDDRDIYQPEEDLEHENLNDNIYEINENDEKPLLFSKDVVRQDEDNNLENNLNESNKDVEKIKKHHNIASKIKAG